MSTKKNKIKDLIQEYLLDEGILRGKVNDPDSKFEFGFTFSFPPGQKSQGMSVLMPKGKNFILIIIQTQLSKPDRKALNSLKDNKKEQFFEDIRRFFLIKELFFRIDAQNYRYEINDQIFIEKDGSISRDSFYRSIRKIFYSYIYSTIILGTYCYGDKKPSQESPSRFDFSLYS